MRLNNPNRLIQTMCRTPESIARLNANPEAVFDEFKLSEKEKAILRLLDPLVMVKDAEIHPTLAMHYLLACQPDVAQSMNISEYPELFEEN